MSSFCQGTKTSVNALGLGKTKSWRTKWGLIFYGTKIKIILKNYKQNSTVVKNIMFKEVYMVNCVYCKT